MYKLIWFDARRIEAEDNMILPLIANSNIDVMVVRAKNRQNYKLPLKTKYVVLVEDKNDLKSVDKNDIVMSSKKELLTEAESKGNKTCIYLAVNDKKSLEDACEISPNYNYVVVNFESETNIPLELLIARLQNTKTTLLKEVKTVGEAGIAFGVMEHGSDGVLLSTTDIEEIVKMKKTIENMALTKIKIVPGKVKEVEHIGMGYRACIDTTSILRENEGMIIGSSSQGGLLVSSETHYLPYMNLRPFRVNAGAVHSYVWCPEDMTEYLTDLKAGSKVLAIDNEGNAREVSVGRIKIEARPLLKIVAEAEGIEVNTIVQDDWHIRLLGMNGEPYNASCISKDTILAAYICESGRHVGIKISEDIIER